MPVHSRRLVVPLVGFRRAADEAPHSPPPRRNRPCAAPPSPATEGFSARLMGGGAAAARGRAAAGSASSSSPRPHPGARSDTRLEIELAPPGASRPPRSGARSARRTYDRPADRPRPRRLDPQRLGDGQRQPIALGGQRTPDQPQPEAAARHARDVLQEARAAPRGRVSPTLPWPNTSRRGARSPRPVTPAKVVVALGPSQGRPCYGVEHALLLLDLPELHAEPPPPFTARTTSPTPAFTAGAGAVLPAPARPPHADAQGPAVAQPPGHRDAVAAVGDARYGEVNAPPATSPRAAPASSPCRPTGPADSSRE